MSKQPPGPRKAGAKASRAPASSARKPNPASLKRGRSPRAEAAPPASTRTRRPRAPSRPSGYFRLARLVALGIAGLLTFQAATMAWEEFQRRGLDLVGSPAGVPARFVVRGTSDHWEDPLLAAAVEDALDSAEVGNVGVYVKNLGSGASAAVRDQVLSPSASLFKVPVLVEVLRQQGLGLHNMSTRVRLLEKHRADGAGVLQEQIGKEFTVRELLDLMIGVSDNVAALALLDLVETDNVNLTLQANGLEATRLRIGDTSRDWGGRRGENTTTAREMGLLLEKLATGRILDEEASEEALKTLSQRQQAAWLPALLPPSTRVAHKSGELPGIRHDAGIVYGPRDQFVVVVTIGGVTDYDEAANLIAHVARVAYDHFEVGGKR